MDKQDFCLITSRYRMALHDMNHRCCVWEFPAALANIHTFGRKIFSGLHYELKIDVMAVKAKERKQCDILSHKSELSQGIEDLFGALLNSTKYKSKVSKLAYKRTDTFEIEIPFGFPVDPCLLR